MRPNVLVANLAKKPGSLHELWVEFEFGAPGKKAAKDFTSAERGKVKYKYCFRKAFWDKVSEMCRAGMSANRACDKVYEAYGQRTSITAILRQMKHDRKHGWPPMLETFIITQ